MTFNSEKRKRDEQPADLAATIDPKLSQVLRFDEHDLFCNRAGYISKEQKERLRSGYWANQVDWPASIVAATATVMFVCACIFGMFLLLNPDSSGKLPGIMAVLAVLFGPFIVGLGAYSLHQRKQLMADLDKGDVSTLAGRTRLDIRSGSSRSASPTFKLTINQQRFKIDKRTLLAFRDGETYRLYYTPNTKRILSAEPVDAEDKRKRRSEE